MPMYNVKNMHEERVDDKFSATDNDSNKFKEILFDRTIEQLEDLDLSSLISYVEDKLNSFSKLQIILLGITARDNYKYETEPDRLSYMQITQKLTSIFIVRILPSCSSQLRPEVSTIPKKNTFPQPKSQT